MKQNDTQLSPSERWEQATLANNFIFCKVMSENIELCRQMLEMLLHIKIDRLEMPLSERSVKSDFNSHGVRFDVYTRDDNRIFDIEVQTTDKKDLPKRARYYQSMMDIDNLQTGDDYDTIKDSYVVFLCLNDIFKKGLPVYSFENICKEDAGIKLEDRTYKIFFNAQKCDIMPTDEQQAFFRFLQGRNAETDFTRRLATEVIRAKHNAQWRMQFMTWEQSIKEEAQYRAEIIAKDMAKDIAKDMTKDTARRLLASKKLSVEEIAEITQLSTAEVQQLQQDMHP